MGQKRSKHNDTVVITPLNKEDVKILLLGASECGKSTFFNQSLEEWNSNQKDMLTSVFNSSMSNLSEMVKRGALDDEEIQSVRKWLEKRNEMEMCESLMSTHSSVNCTDHRLECLVEIWKLYFKKFSGDYQFYNGIENTRLLIDRLIHRSINRDALSMIHNKSVYSLTGGIVERQMRKGVRLIDVGGKRNDRKKWIQCFGGAGIVFFFASLIEFDQVLKEDGSTNRMKESLELFQVTNSKRFTSTRIVLIFTKPDLLVEKMTRFGKSIDLS